ncbi:uncharacterized protein LOC114828376 [Galendromus occidentalis]|uniref:Uncharacterized protein LOC114828376 n=1 Tax=Galendromus occidentalis TaxID=34638 RepID=A0AAJ7SG73_9ACAR|nr:uncharacterized protein LOC114828376 [Galendromus occidentalis]
MHSTLMQAKAKKEVDSSIHVAIEDLHFHMRKCKEEGETLRKQKEHLLQMLDNKTLTTRHLHQSIQQLERMNSELQEKVRTLGEENDRLRKENRVRPVAKEGRKPFKHNVDIMGSESWEDLSMKLLEQMERDINDLHDMGEKVKDRDGSATSTGEAPVKSPTDDREAMQMVTEMKGQLSTIKERLLQQKALLQSAAKEQSSDRATPQRPSDDSFRVFFTQQLSSTKKPDGGKQCPMCEETLPSGTTQAEYEHHVMSHLGAPASHRF